jgi:hypothetical protein
VGERRIVLGGCRPSRPSRVAVARQITTLFTHAVTVEVAVIEMALGSSMAGWQSGSPGHRRRRCRGGGGVADSGRVRV